MPQDIREGSNLIFELKRSTPISREPSESDLSCKDKTDAFKLAGAIAGRVRDGEEVALTVKGPVPVLVSVKAIALAQQYAACPPPNPPRPTHAQTPCCPWPSPWQQYAACHPQPTHTPCRPSPQPGGIPQPHMLQCTWLSPPPLAGLPLTFPHPFAHRYVQEEGIDLKFAVQFRDLEDPELNNTPSTYLHMAIMPRNM